MGERVLIRGPFDTSTGYGNDLVGLTRAMRTHGYDVQILPTEVTPPIPQDIAMLLSRPTESPIFEAMLSRPRAGTLWSAPKAVT